MPRSRTRTSTRCRARFLSHDSCRVLPDGRGVARPFFSLQYNRIEVGGLEESSSATQSDLGLATLFHFASDRTRSQPYLRPFVGNSGISADDGAEDDDDLANQPLVGVGFGLALPSSSRLRTRLELGFARRFTVSRCSKRAPNSISFGLSLVTS